MIKIALSTFCVEVNTIWIWLYIQCQHATYCLVYGVQKRLCIFSCGRCEIQIAPVAEVRKKGRISKPAEYWKVPTIHERNFIFRRKDEAKGFPGEVSPIPRTHVLYLSSLIVKMSIPIGSHKQPRRNSKVIYFQI